MSTSSIQDNHLSQRAAPDPPPPGAESSVRGPALWDFIASEWLKLRTVRASYLMLLGGAFTVLLGAVIVLTLVGAYDAASAAEKAEYESADPTVVVMPFVSFFVGALGGLAITSEYTTRNISSSLIAVPRRRAFFIAKVSVVSAVTLVAGQVFSFAAFLAAWLILGDRPAPINPWSSVADAMPSVLATAIAVLVAALLALGIGAVLRSSTGALVTLGALLLVIPIFAHFLPSPLGEQVSSLMLTNLAAQITDTETPYVLSPVGALIVMLIYVIAALVAGATCIIHRDA